MSGMASFFLTSRAVQGLAAIHREACDERKMGAWTASAYTVLVILARVFLRLEGPAACAHGIRPLVPSPFQPSL